MRRLQRTERIHGKSVVKPSPDSASPRSVKPSRGSPTRTAMSLRPNTLRLSRQRANALERRPQLKSAMREERERESSIIVARLYRLSRNVHFVSDLMAQRVPFLVASLDPNAPPFMLHVTAGKRACPAIFWSPAELTRGTAARVGGQLVSAPIGGTIRWAD